jgi:hypothetical protein
VWTAKATANPSEDSTVLGPIQQQRVSITLEHDEMLRLPDPTASNAAEGMALG